MMTDIEQCFLCDMETGKGGKGDDSLYNDDGEGPFCLGCWDKSLTMPAFAAAKLIKGLGHYANIPDIALIVQMAIDGRVNVAIEDANQAYRDEKQRANKNFDAYISARDKIGEMFNAGDELRRILPIILHDPDAMTWEEVGDKLRVWIALTKPATVDYAENSTQNPQIEYPS